jgi:hypothetical protein
MRRALRTFTSVPLGAVAFDRAEVTSEVQHRISSNGPTTRWNGRLQQTDVMYQRNTVVDFIILEIEITVSSTSESFRRKFEYNRTPCASDAAYWHPVTEAIDYIQSVKLMTMPNYPIVEISGAMLRYYRARYADVLATLPADMAANCIVLPAHNIMHDFRCCVEWCYLRDATDYGLPNTYHALCHRVPHDIAYGMVRDLRVHYKQEPPPERSFLTHMRVRHIDPLVHMGCQRREVEFMQHKRLPDIVVGGPPLWVLFSRRLYMVLDPPTFDVAKLRPRVTISEVYQRSEATNNKNKPVGGDDLLYDTDEILACRLAPGVYDLLPPHLCSTLECLYQFGLQVEYDTECAKQHGVTVEFETDCVNTMRYNGEIWAVTQFLL